MVDGNTPAERSLEDHEVLAMEMELLHGVKVPISSTDSEASIRAQIVQAMHRQAERGERTALCLSGGGIRSATFNLGVLQGLARRGLLARFTYLSTVSGGGYIGSWLSAWIHQEMQQLKTKEPQLVPASTQDMYSEAVASVCSQLGSAEDGQATEPAPVRRLRAYSRYLSPTKGLSGDALALVATYLRNLLLNWLVLVPLMMAVLVLPRLFLSALQLQQVPDWLATLLTVAAAFGIISIISYMASDLPGHAAAASKGPPLATRQPGLDNIWTLGVAPLSVSALSTSILFVWYEKGLVKTERLLGDSLVAVMERMGWDFAACAPVGACGNVAMLAIAGAVLHLVGALFGAFVVRPWRRAVNGSRPGDLSTLLGIVASGAIGGALLAVSLNALHRPSYEWGPDALDVFATLALPGLLMVFWAGMVLFAGIRRRFTSEEDREWWARASGTLIVVSGGWVLLFLFVVHVPQMLVAFPAVRDLGSAGALGAGTALVGLATAVAGYLGREGPKLKQRAAGLANAVGGRLLEVIAAGFIAVLLLVLCLAVPAVSRLVVPGLDQTFDAGVRQADRNAAARIEEDANRRGEVGRSDAKWTPACADEGKHCAGFVERAWGQYVHYLHEPGLGLDMLGVSLLLFGIGMLVSHLTGVNAFSLHAMYGNRLVRAYLGASRIQRRPHWYTGFDRNDNISMESLPGGRRSSVARPKLFQVLNLTLNLVAPAGNRLEWQDRKAAPFTATPLAVGSKVTGYVRSGDYTSPLHAGDGDESNGAGLSLGRALTASGAAASPNMGYHSSSLVSFVMTFFNVRLGAWLPNPRAEFANSWGSNEPPDGVVALLADALGRADDSKPFVNLSDGGHFENLGLYEMVRRRCSRIVVCDATCDPDYRFEDLLGAVRKIRIDLGIVIEFPHGLPMPGGKSRMAIGTIRYATADEGSTDGTLFYLKPVLLGDEPGDLALYAAVTKKREQGFPQQPTTDQFYSEEQFESYRKLGLHSVLTSFVVPNRWPHQAPRVMCTPMGTLFAGHEKLGTGTTKEEAVVATTGPAPESMPSGRRVVDVVRDLRPGVEWLAPLALVGAVGIAAPSANEVGDPALSPDHGASQVIGSLRELEAASRGSTRALEAQNVQMRKLQDAIVATTQRLDGNEQEAGSGLRNALGAAEREARAFAVTNLPGHAASAAEAADDAAKKMRTLRDATDPETLRRLAKAADDAASAAKSLARAADGFGAARYTVSLESETKAAIEDIKKNIQDIRKDMSQVPPRRNIRGAGEAAP